LQEANSPEEAFSKSYQTISDKEGQGIVGATALSFLAQDNQQMIVANAGDCRMIKVDPRGNVKQLTTDNNLDNKNEKERIKQKKGEIKNNYVLKQGQALAPTRTLGDHFFKDVGVIAEPEITFVEELPQNKNNFFVAASDGLWQELNNKQVGVLVKKAKNSKEAVQNLLGFLEKKKDKKLLGNLDNVSIIVLKNN